MSTGAAFPDQGNDREFVEVVQIIDSKFNLWWKTWLGISLTLPGNSTASSALPFPDSIMTLTLVRRSLAGRHFPTKHEWCLKSESAFPHLAPHTASRRCVAIAKH